jgi:hypothetical protein
MSRMRMELQSWEELYAEEIAQFDAIDAQAEEAIEDFGIVYEPYEELDCGGKEYQRDVHRWELDPASADDWDDRAHIRGGPAQRWRHFGH